jgi:hypothetical protein
MNSLMMMIIAVPQHEMISEDKGNSKRARGAPGRAFRLVSPPGFG